MSHPSNKQSSGRQPHELDDEHQRRESEPEADAPEDRPGEPGAEGGSGSPTRDKLPGMPAKGDPSPVGDTDQHSSE